MEGFLVKLGIDPEKTQDLEDAYIFTEEELRSMPAEDMEEVLGAEDKVKVERWIKNGFNERVGNGLDGSKPASAKKTRKNKSKSITRSSRSRKRVSKSRKNAKFSRFAELLSDPENQMPLEVKKINRKHRKEKNKISKKSKGTNSKEHETMNSAESKNKKSNVSIEENKFKQKPIVTEKFENFEKYLENREKNFRNQCSKSTKTCDENRSIVFEITEDDSKEPCGSKAAFIIEEAYENQVLSNQKWVMSTGSNPFAFSNKLWTQRIKIDSEDVLNAFCKCSSWQWTSNWISDSAGEASWTYSSTPDPKAFKSSKTRTSEYRTRCIRRARIIFRSYAFSENELEFEVLNKILLRMIVLLGVNECKFGFEKLETVQKRLYELSKLLAFKKDVYSLFSNAQTSKDPKGEGKSIIEAVENILNINKRGEKKDFKSISCEIEELIDKITVFRSNFIGKRDIAHYLPMFLIKHANNVSNDTGEDFFSVCGKVLSIDRNSSKRNFDLLLNASRIVHSHLNSLKSANVTGEIMFIAEDSLSVIKDIEEISKEIYEVNCSFAPQIGELQIIVALYGEMIKKIKGEKFSEALLVFKRNTTKTFIDHYKKRRMQYPDEMTEFINEDWKEFHKMIENFIINEIEFYLPNFYCPGINEYPGEQTIAKMLGEFLYEVNTYLSYIGPFSYIEKNANMALIMYDTIYEKLKQESLNNYIIPTTYNKLLSDFISYKNVYRNEIEQMVEEQEEITNKNLIQIKNYKNTIGKAFQEKDNPTLKLLNSFTQFFHSLFASFENFILDKNYIEENILRCLKSLESCVESLVDIFVNTTDLVRLEAGVINEFFDEERKYFDVQKRESVTKKSELYNLLHVSRSVRDLEEKNKEKKSKGSSVKTNILCSYYNDLLNFLTVVMDLNAVVERKCSELFKAGKIGTIKIDFSIEKHLSKIDLLVEIICLRILLYDARGSFHSMGDSDNDIESLTMSIAKLGISLDKKNVWNIAEATLYKIFDLLEWILLYSDRTFNVKSTRRMEFTLIELKLSFVFFLSKEQEKLPEEHSKTIMKILELLAMDDAGLLAVYRKVKDKGIGDKNLLDIKQRTNSTARAIDKVRKESISSFFKTMGDEEVPSDDEEGNESALSKYERKTILEKLLRVLSRRPSKLCRKIAEDNGAKLPVLYEDEDESDKGEEAPNTFESDNVLSPSSDMGTVESENSDSNVSGEDYSD